MKFITGFTFSFYRLILAPLLQSLVAALGVASPIGRQCRFEVSCSVYMQQQIEQRGWIVGGWRGLKRLASCHPFNHQALSSAGDPIRS